MEPQAKQLAMEMAQHLFDKRAQNILALDVSKLTILTDVMLICSGRSTIQVRALYEELEKRSGELGICPRRKEGVSEGRWIVLDYENVIVHIFHEQERGYYNLERLWMDGTNQIELPFTQTAG
ncbi:MAG TPA: ribosome silencing factor [Clostridia bacterium]|nr:ribosome silencing factor [Clostridia bacterium]